MFNQLLSEEMDRELSRPSSLDAVSSATVHAQERLEQIVAKWTGELLERKRFMATYIETERGRNLAYAYATIREYGRDALEDDLLEQYNSAPELHPWGAKAVALAWFCAMMGA